jgi:hypothetical protein
MEKYNVGYVESWRSTDWQLFIMNILFLFLFTFTDNRKVFSNHLNKPKKSDLDFITQLSDTLSNRSISNLFAFHNMDKTTNDYKEDVDENANIDDHSNNSNSEDYEDRILSGEDILGNQQINEDTLDSMNTQITEGQNRLPIILEEPQSSYIIKNRAATLTCKAAYALQVRFKKRIYRE